VRNERSNLVAMHNGHAKRGDCRASLAMTKFFIEITNIIST
jgi:hypothetical protein